MVLGFWSCVNFNNYGVNLSCRDALVIDMTNRSQFKCIALISAIVCLFLLSSASVLYGATLPDFERFPPITQALNGPTAVAVDSSDNIYVAESSSNRLLIFNGEGTYLKTIGWLEKPVSVAVKDDGQIYVGSRGTGSVSVYDPRSVLLFKLGRGDGEFSQPNGIAIDGAGNIYVADSAEDNIKVYNPDGSFNFSFGTSGDRGDGQLNFPVSIAINERTGELFVSDLPVLKSATGVYEGARIQVFDLSGGLKRSFGAYGVEKGSLVKPLGVALDDEGRVYVTDSYKNIVSVFDSEGEYLGDIYTEGSPMRTPLGISFSKNTSRLFIASLNTVKIEVYGIDVKMINASAGPGGSISPSGTVYVRKERDQGFKIMANHGYQIEDVVVDGESVGSASTYTFSDVTAPHSIEARFTPLSVENMDSESTGLGRRVALLIVILVIAALVIKRQQILGIFQKKKEE